MYKLEVYYEGCLKEGCCEDGFDTYEEAKEYFYDMLPLWCENGIDEPLDEEEFEYEIVEE